MGNSVRCSALRGELARAGVEQKDVASWLGYDRTQVSKRMSGLVEWRAWELRVVADRLGVPLDNLVDDTMQTAAEAASA